MTDHMALIKKETKEGDLLELDVKNAILTNTRTGKTYELRQLSATTYETLAAGGLINKVRNILTTRGEKIEQ